MLYPLLEDMLVEYGQRIIIKVAANSVGRRKRRGKEDIPGV